MYPISEPNINDDNDTRIFKIKLEIKLQLLRVKVRYKILVTSKTL